MTRQHGSRHVRRSSGFTLIEVLVVVAIIALLISILLPSLSNAREQARRAKCLSNLKSIATAVHSFAAAHKGYAQLICRHHDVVVADPTKTRYDYQRGIYTTTDPPPAEKRLMLKAWPAAYARYLGHTSLKRNENCSLDPYAFETAFANDGNEVFNPEYIWKRVGKYDVAYCASDILGVRNIGEPHVYHMVVSYAFNGDLFGVSKHARVASGEQWPTSETDTGSPLTGSNPEDNIWDQGYGGYSPKLAGQLDRIKRPSEVMMFCDGGNEYPDENVPQRYAANFGSGSFWEWSYPTLAIKTDKQHGLKGPFLENATSWIALVPYRRHGKNGGINISFADGSARFAQATGWTASERSIEWGPNSNPSARIGYARVITGYTTLVRVSPYQVGNVNRTVVNWP